MMTKLKTLSKKNIPYIKNDRYGPGFWNRVTVFSFFSYQILKLRQSWPGQAAGSWDLGADTFSIEVVRSASRELVGASWRLGPGS